MTTTNTYGRQVVVPLTNKSGGGVIAGDVVVVGTANNDAFTTTTSAGFTGTVGIAQETIADNATGRVLISGYAALVNVTASVTRQNFGTTSTTVKKAVDAGSGRTVGTFCQFLTGGTTPDAIVYPADLGSGSGSVATDAIWDAAGDLVVGTGANTAARLAIGATNGMAVQRVSGAVAWAFPPGYEFDYAQITSGVNVTSTTQATPDTIVTANAVTYDGSTAIILEFFSPIVYWGAGGNELRFHLWDGSTDTARMGAFVAEGTTGVPGGPVNLRIRFTPSAASHTYSVRCWFNFANTSTRTVQAGAGTSAGYAPAFIRQTKA